MQAKNVAMPRYKSTGAARCSAIALRATRERAPVISTRPPMEQKIHTGKKEPKMLYSGAWEQPTNTSGAARDKPARAPSEVLRRRARSVDSVFISGQTLSLTFGLSHRVKGRIYWTKVSVDTLVSDHRYQTIVGWKSAHRYFGIEQYVSPIDSAPRFCLNSC